MSTFLGLSATCYPHHALAIFPLPHLLLDMLIHHCPELEELTLSSPKIDATNAPLYDGMALIRGRWPNLHTLKLEQLHFFDTTNAIERNQITAFLLAHPHLRDLAISQEYLPPTVTGLHLMSFRGSNDYNANSYSGDMYRNLKALDLSGTSGTGRDVIQLPSIVESLPHLISLAFSVNSEADLSVELPDGSLKTFRPFEYIHAVLGSGPQLLNLRLKCTVDKATDLALVSYISK